MPVNVRRRREKSFGPSPSRPPLLDEKLYFDKKGGNVECSSGPVGENFQGDFSPRLQVFFLKNGQKRNKENTDLPPLT